MRVPIVSKGGFKFVPSLYGKRLQVQGFSSFCVLLFLSPLNQSGVPQQGTLARIPSPVCLPSEAPRT